MILKFQLTKFHKGLAFQVIAQNPLFLNTNANEKITFESKFCKLRIVSHHLTRFNLNEYELHLRGSSLENLLEIPTTKFETNQARDTWYNIILDGITKWARTCEKFKEINEKKTPVLKKRGYTYEI